MFCGSVFKPILTALTIVIFSFLAHVLRSFWQEPIGPFPARSLSKTCSLCLEVAMDCRAPDATGPGTGQPPEDEIEDYLRDTEVAGAEALLTEAQEAPSEGCAYFAEEEVLRAAEVMASYRDHVRSKAAAAQARAEAERIEKARVEREAKIAADAKRPQRVTRLRKTAEDEEEM